MNVLKKLRCVRLKNTIYSQRLISIKPEDVEKLSGTSWDIVISGGGMVGCALAASLGSSSILSGKKVLLLESSVLSQQNVDPNCFSNRVCALNKNTKLLFESLQVWNKICNVRAKEVRKMVVWEACSDARISFQHENMQNDVAYIVENNVILNALSSRIDEMSDRIDIIRGVKATDYQFPNNESELVTIHLQNDISISTKLLIGADGINSSVRKKMNVKYISWNYDQKGIVATLKLSEPTENIVAWQRFLPTGPIALLPLSDDMCSLVWTVTQAMSEQLLSMSDEQFVDALNSASWDEESKDSLVESVLGSLKKVFSSISIGSESIRQLPPSILSIEPKSRASFPLGLGHSTQYVAPRVALVGDSAHRVHPLAGQGVNLGFGDVKSLTECLETTVYNGASIGTVEYLFTYETKRQRHVLPTMFSIDALNRLYSTQLTPIVLLRSLGVAALDACPPIKAKIMRQASE